MGSHSIKTYPKISCPSQKSIAIKVNKKSNRHQLRHTYHPNIENKIATFYFFNTKLNSKIYLDHFSDKFFPADTSKFSNTKYHYLPNHDLTWYEAFQFCQSMSMDLAKFLTIQEFRTVERYLFEEAERASQNKFNTTWWTAGKRYKNEHNWFWAPNDKTLPISNFHPDTWKNRFFNDRLYDSNDKLTLKSTCLHIQINQKLEFLNFPENISNYSCSDFRTGVICESRRDANLLTSSIMPQISVKYGKFYTTYQLFDNIKKSWSQAAIFCQQRKMQLASFQNKFEFYKFQEKFRRILGKMDSGMFWWTAGHFLDKKKEEPKLKLEHSWFQYYWDVLNEKTEEAIRGEIFGPVRSKKQFNIWVMNLIPSPFPGTAMAMKSRIRLATGFINQILNYF